MELSSDALREALDLARITETNRNERTVKMNIKNEVAFWAKLCLLNPLMVIVYAFAALIIVFKLLGWTEV
jgi:hypothetical protein